MSLDDKLKSEILTKISLEGSTESSDLKVHIASRSQGSALISFSTGLPRLTNAKDFSFLVSRPSVLFALNPLQFRCCLCGKVVSFPCWYLNQKFAINSIHYFVCFHGTASVNTRCYRKD